MFYEEVILERCNRTSLNGKDRIVIRPTSKTQLVLGTNSSGKSSLLELGFSPIPPDPHNFDKPGFWSVRFNHKGRSYYETAEYGEKSSRYAFYVDGGENLNRGGTITMQLELIKQYLSYDKELHSFLTGNPKFRFTAMDAKRRQHWIAKFSANDFTYAFDRYNSYKRQANEAVKIVKYLKNELAEAKGRLLNENDLAILRRNADELHQTLELLMLEPRCTDPVIDVDRIGRDIDQLVDKFARYGTAEYPDTAKASSLNNLSDLKVELELHLSALEGELSVRAQRLTECEQRKGRADELAKTSPAVLATNIREMKEYLSTLPELQTGIHDSLLVPSGRLAVDLRLCLAELPSERRNESEATVLQETVYQAQIRLGRVTTLLESIKQQADYIHKCEEVECPDCHSRFKPGIKPGELAEIQQRIANGEQLKAEQAEQLRELEVQLADIVATINAYRTLDDLRNQYQRSHSGLFSYFDQFGWKELGKQLGEKLALYDRDVKVAHERRTIVDQIDSLERALQTARIEAGELANASDEYQTAFTAYTTLHQKIVETKARKQRLQTAYMKMEAWDNMMLDCDQAYDSVKQQVISFINRTATNMVDNIIREVKKKIGVHEAALSENDTYQMLAKDLEIKLERMELRKEAFTILTEEMSPKAGMIAEQISEQMSTILRTPNDIIESVWGYSLSISQGEIGEGDLDYNFPMMVEGTPRPDISAGSSSVKDIVDQAMRLTGYVCMDLTDYPLWIDELGGTFDPAHQQNLIPFLKGLIDDPRFSQVLMISHSLDGQTSFPGAEVIILDDRNIKFPYKYNEHVEFS